MLEQCYYYGLTPDQAYALTPKEMAEFIEANHKRQVDDWRMIANVGYSAGCIGSMALAKKRPRFDEVFNFPEEKSTNEVEVNKAQMIVWAENMNREYRKSQKEAANNGRKR